MNAKQTLVAFLGLALVLITIRTSYKPEVDAIVFGS
jgi:hypothetical protein